MIGQVGATTLTPPFRLADTRDVGNILPLAASTVPGFVDHLWASLAGEGQTARDFGHRAQLAFVEAGQTIVADIDGTIAAMMISYPMADAPNPHVPGMHDLLKPLVALFAQASGSWYLHGLATAPRFAGRGYASRLAETAESLGKAVGRPSISLVVVDNNQHAIGFYERRGYNTAATEPVVKCGWDTDAENWLLMTKPLA